MKVQRILIALIILAAGLGLALRGEGQEGAIALAAPVFSEAFWKHWGDGQAELAGYDLQFPRYGQMRKGTAVTIFVSETFSNRLRVKADAGKHPASDQFPVMKLNLIRDFSTGIYDYNTMLSAFSALSPVNGRSAGALTKLSFSSQEWCGQVYSQLLFDKAKLRFDTHSYFDGEADARGGLENPADGLSEDALLLWARGLAAPAIAPGGELKVQMLTSLEVARHLHQPLVWRPALLARSAKSHSLEVPAGRFEVESYTCKISGARSWTIEIEKAAPHRLIRWRADDGREGRLVGTARMKYWQLNGEGGQKALAKLGLKRRGPRTP